MSRNCPFHRLSRLEAPPDPDPDRPRPAEGRVDDAARGGHVVGIAAGHLEALDELADLGARVEQVAREDLRRPRAALDAGAEIDGEEVVEVAVELALQGPEVAGALALVGGADLDIAFRGGADREFVAGPGSALEVRRQRQPGAGGREQLIVGNAVAVLIDEQGAVEIVVGDAAEILGELGIVVRRRR